MLHIEGNYKWNIHHRLNRPTSQCIIFKLEKKNLLVIKLSVLKQGVALFPIFALSERDTKS